jgi:hypothetical protein
MSVLNISQYSTTELFQQRIALWIHQGNYYAQHWNNPYKDFDTDPYVKSIEVKIADYTKLIEQREQEEQEEQEEREKQEKQKEKEDPCDDAPSGMPSFDVDLDENLLNYSSLSVLYFVPNVIRIMDGAMGWP